MSPFDGRRYGRRTMIVPEPSSRTGTAVRRLRPLLLLPLLALMSGCEAVFLSPAGDIAAQHRDLLVWSVV
ncbi:MAG: ubiquinol oxidase subunit II, partial [Brevundimonas sp.]